MKSKTFTPLPKSLKLIKRTPVCRVFDTSYVVKVRQTETQTRWGLHRDKEVDILRGSGLDL